MRVIAVLYLFLMVLATDTAMAQNDLITEPTLLYRKRILYGANLNSAELGGINFKYQWQKTHLLKNGFDIELARLRHPKEERVYSPVSQSPRRYTPGRINMAFFLRTGYGQNVFITRREYKNAISLHYNYSIGATTALLKPIYIDARVISTDFNDHIATEKYDPVNKHKYPSDVFGNASFLKGFSELSARFGGHFKNSLSVEWGAYPEDFYSLEAGFVVDVFGRNLPLMADEFTKNKNVYFTLFLGFTLGHNK
jgi:hypothetical protein